MLQLFKRNKTNGSELHAVVNGTVKSLEKVEDQVFSRGLVGRGLAIVPEDAVICAPCAATVSMIFPTGHALGLTDESGLEYLLHIGVDTVKLQGAGFTVLVEHGSAVKQGEPLVKVDFDLLRERGYQTDIIVLLTSPAETSSCTFCVQDGQSVTTADAIFCCERT